MFPLMGKIKALNTGLGYETALTPMVEETDNWRMLPWEKYQRNVRRLQQRIYQATTNGADDNSSVSEEPREEKFSRGVREERGSERSLSRLHRRR